MKRIILESFNTASNLCSRVNWLRVQHVKPARKTKHGYAIKSRPRHFKQSKGRYILSQIQTRFVWLLTEDIQEKGEIQVIVGRSESSLAALDGSNPHRKASVDFFLAPGWLAGWYAASYNKSRIENRYITCLSSDRVNIYNFLSRAWLLNSDALELTIFGIWVV